MSASCFCCMGSIFFRFHDMPVLILCAMIPTYLTISVSSEPLLLTCIGSMLISTVL